MTVLAKGTHTSCRWRAKVSLSGTSRPSRRTTQPDESSWPKRIVRAAWIEGDAWYRWLSAYSVSLEILISPGEPASMAESGLGFSLPFPSRLGGSLRTTRLRRSRPDDMAGV